MKKIIVLFFFLLFIFNINKVYSAGSFEFNNLPDSFKLTAGQKFEAYVNFFYSGTVYTPRGTFIGSDFPPGLKTEPVTYGGGGSYSFLYKGIPLKPGTYHLTAALTDDYGALLNKKIDIIISGLIFSEESLPNAEIKKPYTYDLNYTYAGEDAPLLSIDNVSPRDLNFSYTHITAENGHFKLRLISYKPGKYTFRATAIVNNAELGQKIFTLIVNDPNVTQTENTPPVVVTQPLNTTINTPIIEKEPIVTIKNKTSSKSKIKEDKSMVDNNKESTKSVISEEIVPVVNTEPVPKIKWYQKIINWLKGK